MTVDIAVKRALLRSSRFLPLAYIACEVGQGGGEMIESYQIKPNHPSER